MVGNSWLATEQWTTAIQKPPALKCIAPWEAFTDLYRDLVCRGGIPKTNFASFVFNKTIRGRANREDIGKALEQWPLMNGYWEDKIYDTSVITIPIYALASYSSGNHGSGTVRGFYAAASEDKWIRFHSTQEWYDLYTPKYIDDLQKFFDRYLKGIQNDWELTPKARVSILTYGNRSEPVSLTAKPYSHWTSMLTIPCRARWRTSHSPTIPRKRPSTVRSIFIARASLQSRSKSTETRSSTTPTAIKQSRQSSNSHLTSPPTSSATPRQSSGCHATTSTTLTSSSRCAS